MLFKFNVEISEEDYYKFNVFMNLKSHYLKNQFRGLKIFFAVCIVLISLIMVIGGGFDLESIISIIPLMILLVLITVGLDKFLCLFLKSNIKHLKKKGKLPYSKNSVLEFYEDCLVEITPECKTEQKYSLVERVTIIENEAIYIHIDSMRAFLIPVSSFESKEEYRKFLEFLTEKNFSIKTY